MKLAIPTDDGLTLSDDIGSARGFLIINVQLGEIVHEELRWVKPLDNLRPPERFPDTLRDCQAVMVCNSGNSPSGVQKDTDLAVILTGETIITNAYIQFLNNSYREEANTCCCP